MNQSKGKLKWTLGFKQMIHYTKFALLLLSTLISVSAIAAETEYAHGHGALEIFDGAGFLETPLWVQIWVVLLLSTFVVGFCFAIKHPIARWSSAGLIASLTSGHAVFDLLGLPFLGGSIAIMHIVCWTPALWFLLSKRPFLDTHYSNAFRLWSAVMTFVILFSFVFDIKDAAIYISHF